MALSVDFGSQIVELVLEYGLIALFVVLTLDSAMVLPFVPGELLLVLAAQRMASSYYELGVAVLVATAGTTFGSFLLYLLARYGGRRFIITHPRVFLMSPDTRDRLERTFQHFGGQLLVFFLRLIPFTRVIVSLPAGLARMPMIRFLIFTGAGNLVFCGGVMGLTYESRQPGSVVAAYARTLRIEYVQPAWDLIRVNWLWTSAILVLILLAFAIWRSMRVAERPTRGASPGLLDNLATWLLIGLGLFLVVGVWTDPELVYGLVSATGLDLGAAAADLPGGELLLTFLVGCLILWLGVIVAAINRRAQNIAHWSRQSLRVRLGVDKPDKAAVNEPKRPAQ